MSQLTQAPSLHDETPTLRGITIASPRALIWQRIAMLMITIVPLAGVVYAIQRLWGTGISPVDAGLLLGFYLFSGLGVTVGFHRLFTHRSFRASPGLRRLLAVAGSFAIEGSVIDWVAAHRRHHAYSDSAGDPHSPHVDMQGGSVGMFRGLWYAHLGWMFSSEATVKEEWAPDLIDDPVVRRISDNFGWFVLASFTAPAILGGLITWSWAGAFTGFVWGALVRIFVLHHVTWSINSICHVFGTRPFDSHDEARNNVAMALIGFGEGWHNAHHAFPASARHGLRWWEFDLSYVVIRGLALMRLAGDIKVPSPAQIARKLRANRLGAVA